MPAGYSRAGWRQPESDPVQVAEPIPGRLHDYSDEAIENVIRGDVVRVLSEIW
jgi:hypothetical protein